MAECSFVAAAVARAGALVWREARGPGDLDNAMRRIEARFGLPYATLWALRYRVPKSVDAGFFARLAQAFEMQCQRQERFYAGERDRTAPQTPLGKAFVRAAAAVAGATVLGEDDDRARCGASGRADGGAGRGAALPGNGG